MNKKNINLGIWCLTFNCLLIKIFIGFSNILLHETGSSSCLALIFSFAVFTAILFIVYFFKRYFILSLKNTYLRNTIFVILIGYLISHNIYFIYQLINTINNSAYPNTPLWIVLTLIAVTVLIVGIRDFSSILKLHSICVPLIIIGLIIISISSIKYDDIYNALPVLGNGIASTISSGFKHLFAFSEIIVPIVFLTIMPEEKSKNINRSKIILYSAIIGAGIYSIFTIISLLAIPTDSVFVAENNPLFHISRFSGINRLNTRLDVLNIIISITSGILYLSTSLAVIRILMKKIGLPKNSFMKTTASILVLLIGIVPLCGCYDNRDIEDTAYAIAVGVDKDENTGSLIFSFQFTNPLTTGENTDPQNSGSEESETENKSVNNISIDADNIFDGLESVKRFIGKTPSLSHLKLIVFSKSITNSDGYLKNICEDFININDVRPETKICIASTDTAKEYLYGVNPSLEESTARYYELLFSDSSTTETLQTNLRTFLIKLTGSSGDGYLPIISPDGFTGAILFSGEIPKIELSNHECQIINILLGIERDSIFFTSESTNQVYKIKSSSPNIKTNIENKKISAEIETKIFDKKNQNGSEDNYELLYEDLMNDSKNLIEKIYQNQCDILSIGKFAKSKFLYEYEWKNVIQEKENIINIPTVNINLLY